MLNLLYQSNTYNTIWDLTPREWQGRGVDERGAP